jgi:hypothetical protein
MPDSAAPAHWQLGPASVDPGIISSLGTRTYLTATKIILNGPR